MLDLSKLTQKAKVLLRKSGLPVCIHEYKENGQVLTRFAPKKYKLRNRLTCKHCKEDRLSDIGDN